MSIALTPQHHRITMSFIVKHAVIYLGLSWAISTTTAGSFLQTNMYTNTTDQCQDQVLGFVARQVDPCNTTFSCEQLGVPTLQDTCVEAPVMPVIGKFLTVSDYVHAEGCVADQPDVVKGYVADGECHQDVNSASWFKATCPSTPGGNVSLLLCADPQCTTCDMVIQPEGCYDVPNLARKFTCHGDVEEATSGGLEGDLDGDGDVDDADLIYDVMDNAAPSSQFSMLSHVMASLSVAFVNLYF